MGDLESNWVSECNCRNEMMKVLTYSLSVPLPIVA